MRTLARALISAAVSVVLTVTVATPAARAATTSTASFSLSITYRSTLTTTSTARFHGSVSHVPTSTSVEVQRRTTSGIWRTVATARTGSRGAFTGTFTPSGLGPTAFRAHVAAARGRPAVDSPSRTVTVSEFFFLDRIPLAHPADGVTFGPITGSGQTFPHSFVMDGAAVKGGTVTATWTIGGHCSEVFAVVGLPDSEDGLVGVVGVGDGTSGGNHLLSANTVASDGFNLIHTPILGVSDLLLATSIRKPGTGGQKVDWADVSILCSVDPRSL